MSSTKEEYKVKEQKRTELLGRNKSSSLGCGPQEMIHVLQGCGRFQNRKLWFAAEGQPLTLPLLQLNYEIFHNMQLPAGLLLAVGENVWPGFSTLPLSPFCTAGTDREDSEKCPRVREQ
ncbi:cell division protein kinase 10, partial [Trichinella spiralis]|uniref:cell division protein kinase 10 n=1 Tax=Trichinella spiralis TaxID=6334 RepID=UPI0001EFDCA3